LHQFSSSNTTAATETISYQTIGPSILLSQEQKNMFNAMSNSNQSAINLQSSIPSLNVSSSPVAFNGNKNSSCSHNISPNAYLKVPQSNSNNLFDSNENKLSPSPTSNIRTNSPSPTIVVDHNNHKVSHNNENKNKNNCSSNDNTKNTNGHNTSSLVKPTWTLEQEKLGNALYEKLQSQYPSRAGKLVGMILEECKHNKNNMNTLIENEKLFSNKIAALNKILDDTYGSNKKTTSVNIN
jgi:hypothetical protein